MKTVEKIHYFHRSIMRMSSHVEFIMCMGFDVSKNIAEWFLVKNNGLIHLSIIWIFIRYI